MESSRSRQTQAERQVGGKLLSDLGQQATGSSGRVPGFGPRTSFRAHPPSGLQLSSVSNQS